MKNPIRFGGAALVTMVLVGLAAAPAFAGATPRLRVAARIDGPYREIVSRDLAAGEKKTFFFKAKSTDGQKSDASFAQNSGIGSEYTVKYFRNDQNITAAVTTDVYEFTVAPKVKRFRVIVKVTSGPPAPGCIVDELQTAGGESFTGISINGGNCT